jgi:hypothetical protein
MRTKSSGDGFNGFFFGIQSIFKRIDLYLIRLWRIDKEAELDFQKQRQEAGLFDGVYNGAVYDMQMIDSKSSALLTHISIILAVLSFLLNQRTGTPVDLLVVAELGGYTIAALFVLRCVDIMGPPFRELPRPTAKLERDYCIEVRLRREIYTRALRAVWVMTVFLIPTYVLHFTFQNS